MKLLAQIAAGVALAGWPLVFMMYVISMNAADEDDPRKLAVLFFVLIYPAALGLVCFSQRWSLLGISPAVLLVLSIGAAVYGFGTSYQMFLNAVRGIKNSGYTVTEDVVYANGTVLAEADPKTFKLISQSERHTLRGYARDANHVYDDGRILPGVDPKTFELIRGGRYTRDATHVFVNHQSVDGADPKSAEWLSWNGEPTEYWCDKNAAYHSEKRIALADPASFTLISQFYAQDGMHVFLGEEVVEGAEAATFRHLEGLVGKDASRVYFRTKAIFPDADVARFTMRDEWLGEDGRYLYYFGGGVEPAAFEADADTFEVMGDGYAKDVQRVFYLRKSVKFIEGADAASFRVREYSLYGDLRPDDPNRYDAEDKNHRYYQGRPITG